MRSESVRQSNLTAVLRALHLDGRATRSELVARTGLTRSSVADLVGALDRAGLVVEERARSDGSPGRPSPIVRPRSDDNVVVAIEISVDSIAGAVVGLGGTVLVSHRIDRLRDRRSVDRTIGDVAALVAQLMASQRIGVQPLGVGVATAGLVRRPESVVALAPNLGWREVALGQLLADALPFRAPISVANDADMAALAETRRGAATGVDDVLFIAGEVGVGGGAVTGGRSLIGAAGFAGEVGHLIVNPDGRTCRCGATGCWETEVGEGALLRRADRPADSGRRGVDAVLADAAAGKPSALAALDAEAHWLAVGLAGLINVLNPRLVVIGGLFGRIFPLIGERLRTELDQLALAVATADLEIVPSALGDDAALVGAAELAFETLLADPLGMGRDQAARRQRA